MKTILWAYDPFGMPAAESPGLVATLSALQAATGARILPVHVLTPSSIQLQLSLMQPHVRQYLPSAESVARESLAGVGIEGMSEPEVIVQRGLRVRDAVGSLLAFARARKADLIVTGTHAEKGVSRLLLGSFAETLLLQSKVPVLACNPRAKASEIRRILFPSDLQARSKAVFDRACGLARLLGAEIELFHVTPHPVAQLVQSGVYLVGGGWVPVSDYMSTAEQSARRTAERWQAAAAKKGTRVRTAFATGAEGVRVAVLERARDVGFDLIALEARSGALGSALVGSISRQILRQAGCPVWVLQGKR
jgi:nucleotide-binding universal stress UspA family protein